jgi:CRP/FNR family transcriptional regulator, anaerobic regulatory protein
MQQLNDYIRTSFQTEVAEAESISSFFHHQLLKKGEFLIRAGRPCDCFAFVASGLIRIYLEVDDREVTQWIVTKNYFTTDLSSFILNKPGRWNMQALEDSDIWVIQKEDYQKLASVVPRWVEFERLLLIHCFVYLEERVLSHLYMTAEERFHHLFTLEPALFNKVPLQYLASMLGMTPETLSRLRKKRLT